MILNNIQIESGEKAMTEQMAIRVVRNVQIWNKETDAMVGQINSKDLED